MENAGYTALTRQSGLLREMQTVANNIANVSTTGYRREGLVFSEFVRALGPGQPSLSMGRASARSIDLTPGPMTQTGGSFDLAIEGAGFFLVQIADGAERLTRAGSFVPGADGTLMTADGYRLLDAGRAPVSVPPGVGSVSVAADGTVSADGQPLARIGLFLPDEPQTLSREGSSLFAAGELREVQDGRIRQGFLEGSNVNPVAEIARMIEVQRSYELTQQLLSREDERIRGVVETLGR